MGSKGRIPPPHLRRPGIVHHDPFGPGIHPPPGAFPPFDMLPPPEVLEQKLATQHMEMQKLVTENQRLAATHGNLRQELAAAQHELQLLHAHVGAVKSEREQQMTGLMDKIAKMESELQAAEPIKMELQQARADAQSLVATRQELISKVQQLGQDLQGAHSDLQQFPALIAELESLRQEYQHCRATFDFEKKLYNDHLESLQVMEKNYVTMAREVEKLRAQLTNTANNDRRAGMPYGGSVGYNESDAAGNYPVGQNAYHDNYGVFQGRGPLPLGANGTGAVVGSSGASTPHSGAQTGPPPVSGDIQKGFDAQRGASGSSYDAQRGHNLPAYDAQRIPGYDSQKGPDYNLQKGSVHNSQRGPNYDVQKDSNYDSQRGHGYDVQRGAGYEAQQHGASYDLQRGSNYDTSKAGGYEASSRGAVGPQGQGAPVNNAPYGSATPPTRVARGYEPPRGGNALRR